MELRSLQAGSTDMKQRIVLSYAVFIAALAFAAAPFFTPFNGFDPSAYPIPQYNPPVQPAGYAFAIWGLIYVWLIISTGFGAIRRLDDDDWAPHRLPLLISLGVGSIWLWVAGQSPVWATILIWIMLITAIAAVLNTPRRERILLRAPLGLYAGWLTAASWVSIGLLGAGYGITFEERGWAILCVFAAFAMAAWVIMRLKSAIFYMAGVAWALVAVAVKTAQTTPIVALLAGLGAMALGLLTLWGNSGRPQPR